VNLVAQTLFNLYCEDRLAPFYIIRPPVTTNAAHSDETLKKVYIDLSCLVLARHKNPDPEHTLSIGHSDILFIEKEEKLKDYKQDDLGMQQFFSAQKHGPLKLDKKFIWIDQAHHITERFLNKWLKTLEEPTAAITTLFLVPHHGPLLKTIESRAITLKISDSSAEHYRSELFENFSDFLHAGVENEALIGALGPFLTNSKFVHEAIENLKTKPELQEEFFTAFQDYWSVSKADPHRLERALEEIKWHKQSKTFHNIATERLYGLLACLSDQT